MSKFFSLLRATMSEGIQIFNYRAKTEKSKRIMPIVLAILTGIMMFLSADALMQTLKEKSAEITILPLFTLLTSIIIVTEGIYKSGDLLFHPKDNDLLLSMPIPRSTIVATKILKFYAFELFYCLIFLLPAIVVYAINVSITPLFYLIAPITLILTPIIPITLSCVIGLISSALSSRFKRRSFPQVFMSLLALFILAITVIFFSSNPDPNEYLASIAGSNLASAYYPAAAFASLVNNFNLLQLFLFIAINLIVLLITVFVIGHFYFKIITRLNVTKEFQSKTTNYKSKSHGQTFALIKKEIIKYFDTPVLLSNTAIGLVLFLVAIGAVCFKSDELVANLTSSTENFPLTPDEILSFLPSINFALVAFTSLMTFITATSISLEGKTFNLLKTLPISGKKVIISKVLAAMLLIVPITTLGSLALFIKFHFDLIDIMLILIAIVFIPLATELIGILIDLKYARFDAESDAVVVRQSPGVMVATFLGLGMVLATISLAFVVIFIAGQTTGLIMMDAIFVIISAFLLFIAITRGEERYTKLSA